MDILGWIMAGCFSMVLVGVVLGARLFKLPTIVNAPHAEAHATGGAGGSPSGARSAPIVFPIMALGAVVVLAIMTINISTSATNAVNDTAARSIDVQRETLKMIPTAAPPVIVTQPAPVVVTQPAIASPSIFADVLAIASLIVVAVSCGIGVYMLRAQRKAQSTQRAAQLKWYSTPSAQAPLTAGKVEWAAREREELHTLN